LPDGFVHQNTMHAQGRVSCGVFYSGLSVPSRNQTQSKLSSGLSLIRRTACQDGKW